MPARDAAGGGRSGGRIGRAGVAQAGAAANRVGLDIWPVTRIVLARAGGLNFLSANCLDRDAAIILTKHRIPRDLTLGILATAWAAPTAPEVLWLTEDGPWGNAFELVARANTGYPTVTPDGRLTRNEALEMLFACKSIGCPRVGGIYKQRFIEPIGSPRSEAPGLACLASFIDWPERYSL